MKNCIFGCSRLHWIYRNRLDRRQVSTLISLSEVVVGEIYGRKVINNMEVHRNRRLRVALQKELEQLEKQEKRMEKNFSKQEPPEWKFFSITCPSSSVIL